MALISLEEESIGGYVHKSYATSKTLEEATSRKNKSMTSVEYAKACLGRIPTHQEIENKRLFSPEQARKEFFSSLLIGFSDFARLLFGKMGPSYMQTFSNSNRSCKRTACSQSIENRS